MLAPRPASHGVYLEGSLEAQILALRLTRNRVPSRGAALGRTRGARGTEEAAGQGMEEDKQSSNQTTLLAAQVSAGKRPLERASASVAHGRHRMDIQPIPTLGKCAASSNPRWACSTTPSMSPARGRHILCDPCLLPAGKHPSVCASVYLGDSILISKAPFLSR